MKPESNPAAIRRSLEHLLQSETLAGAEQLQKLIEYLVRNTLEGRTSQLNEVAVAENVLGRKKDFVALTDSSARKAMSRLRARLRAYYEREGSTAEVRFVLHKYRVRFERGTPRVRRRPRVLLLPLQPVNFHDSGRFTAGLTEDLRVALAGSGRLEVAPEATARDLRDKTAGLREYHRLTAADILLDGAVRKLDGGAHQITLIWVDGLTATHDADKNLVAAIRELARQITIRIDNMTWSAGRGAKPFL